MTNNKSGKIQKRQQQLAFADVLNVQQENKATNFKNGHKNNYYWSFSRKNINSDYKTIYIKLFSENKTKDKRLISVRHG